jgi:hypothetical protein
LSNWKAADYFPDTIADAQKNRSRADVEYVMHKIYPLFSAFARLYSDGVIKALTLFGSDVLPGFALINFCFYSLHDIPMPQVRTSCFILTNQIYPKLPALNDMLIVNYLGNQMYLKV